MFLIVFGALLIGFLNLSAQNITIGILSVITLFITSLLAGRVLIKSTVPILRKFSPLFYSLSLIVGIVFVSGFTIMAAQNFLSLKKAEKLIHNISQYKNVSGQFPESLDALKPEFYSAIPKASVGLSGSDFLYTTDKHQQNSQVSILKRPLAANEFKLTFISAFGIEYSYYSNNKRWESPGDYEFEKISPIDLTEPITSFLMSPRISKEQHQK